MLNIAICDDEWYVCDQIAEYLKIVSKEMDIFIATDLFTNSNMLCKKVKKYDLIYLDILLNVNFS